MGGGAEREVCEVQVLHCKPYHSEDGGGTKSEG